jgi:hypothetical protein
LRIDRGSGTKAGRIYGYGGTREAGLVRRGTDFKRALGVERTLILVFLLDGVHHAGFVLGPEIWEFCRASATVDAAPDTSIGRTGVHRAGEVLEPSFGVG